MSCSSAFREVSLDIWGSCENITGANFSDRYSADCLAFLLRNSERQSIISHLIRYGVVANISRSHNLRDQYRGAQGSIPCTGVTFCILSHVIFYRQLIASFLLHFGWSTQFVSQVIDSSWVTNMHVRLGRHDCVKQSDIAKETKYWHIYSTISISFDSCLNPAILP